MLNGGDAAIVGIGATEFSKRSGRSELRLAVEAITAGLADAGLEPEEIAGLVTFTMDSNDEMAVARSLGLNRVTFFAETPNGGGGGCGTVALAALAVAAGLADVVVCYRAMNERSGARFGAPPSVGSEAGPAASWDVDVSWTQPHGLATPAGWMALAFRRYMYEFGVTSEDFGRVAVVEREYAAANPAAWFYGRPITLDDHQCSRMIADPLRLLDCCQESDGAVALVITSSRRAKQSKQPVVQISAAAQGIGPQQVGVASYYRQSLSDAPETAIVAEQLWRQSGLSAAQMDLAIIYDHFTPSVLMSLEALGVCNPGEAAQFVREGGLGRSGRLPTNTNGGQLGEGYIHGFNGIAEAVRQLRGTAVNQVDGAQHAVVTSGSHVPTSGLVLSRV